MVPTAGGRDVPTPPKQPMKYKHDVSNVFGFWTCGICKGQWRSRDMMESTPCNFAFVQKLMEIES